MRRIVGLVIASAMALPLVGLGVPPVAAVGAPAAHALDTPAGRLPSTQPAKGTPHVLDGRVLSVVQVGDTILLGGTFTTARNSGDTTQLSRTSLLAFDRSTGVISPTFVPQPNGPVEVLLPAGDGKSVYVGGNFSSIAGTARKNLVRINVADGSIVPGFDPGDINGKVNDLRLSGGRLWVAGRFTQVNGKSQRVLATLDPTTGAFDPYMRLRIDGIHNGGTTSVSKIDVAPDGRDLVAIGNFRTLEGVRNQQVLRLDLSSPTAAAPENWRTSFFETPCNTAFWTTVHDVDISPDGSYFVVVTTGTYGGADTSCDSSSRFEIDGQGSGVAPSWVDTSGGDTMWSVEITDSVIYLGGHFKFQNNPAGANVPGPGAVSRPGIAALDPVNGLPLSWNPTRTRGVGLFDFLVTSDGLWVASDTDRIGDNHYRGRIALMPWAGGTSFPAVGTPGLPNDLYEVTADALVKHAATQTGVGAGTPAPSGVDWRAVKAAFMLNGEVYLATGDGKLVRRSFDGTAWGAPVPVDTADLLTPLKSWADDVKAMTGLFYDSGRLYFTRSRSKQLYYRYFTPESGVVGAGRYVASSGVSGIAFDQVKGMFLAGDRLYWTTKDSSLRSIQWARAAAAGAPVGGTQATVESPHSWSNARSPFLFQGTAAPAKQAPSAAFVASCTTDSCAFDASSSTDPDDKGGALAYAWDFGDGTTASGVTASHRYAAMDSYQVTLTVTDGDGLSDSTTRTVTPSAAAVVAVGSAGSNGNRADHTVTVPATVREGDRMLLFMTLNNAAVSLTEPAGWTLLPGTAVSSSGLRQQVWTRVAGASDAGSTVRVRSSETVKSDLGLTVYRPTPGSTLTLAGSVGATRPSGATSYATPEADVPTTGAAWVVSYWGTKSTSNPTWTAPAGELVRSASVGSGSGGVSALLADSGGAVPGPRGGGRVATLDVPGGQTATSTVVLVARPPG